MEKNNNLHPKCHPEQIPTKSGEVEGSHFANGIHLLFCSMEYCQEILRLRPPETDSTQDDAIKKASLRRLFTIQKLFLGIQMPATTTTFRDAPF